MEGFYIPRQNVPATVAIFQAVPQGTNAGRGENTKGSENIIANGSKIVVPEGTALITIQDGQLQDVLQNQEVLNIDQMIQIQNHCLQEMGFFHLHWELLGTE